MNVVSPDARGQVDPTIFKNILAHLPDLPIALVPISYFPDFEFKPMPASSKYCLIDFMEPYSRNAVDPYSVFLDWVRDNPPALTFRRELEASSASETVLPIEFPAYLPLPPVQSKAEFNARPLDVFYFWGYSHPSRPLLHADIFRGMAEDGIDVLPDWDDFGQLIIRTTQRYWAAIYAPYWRRITMTSKGGPLEWMQQAKITVAMPGNGVKTFRHAECINTLMATPFDNLAWSYPWGHGINCLRLEPGGEYECLRHDLARPDGMLYEIYVKCCENMKHYEAPTYAREYVAKAIEAVL